MQKKIKYIKKVELNRYKLDNKSNKINHIEI